MIALHQPTVLNTDQLELHQAELRPSSGRVALTLIRALFKIPLSFQYTSWFSSGFPVLGLLKSPIYTAYYNPRTNHQPAVVLNSTAHHNLQWRCNMRSLYLTKIGPGRCRLVLCSTLDKQKNFNRWAATKHNATSNICSISYDLHNATKTNI